MDSNLAAYAAYEAEKRRQTEQQQQNQPNLIDALGKLALGAGAVAAGAYGVRRMLQPGAVAPSKVAPSPTEVRRAAGAVPADVARQQRGIELTRQARAERPQGVRQGNLKDLIESVNVQDLGPTDFPVSPERAKIDLSFINNVLIPMEQKRLPSATDFLQQRLRGQATELPASYYQRTPSTFAEFSKDPARALLTDPKLLKYVEAEEAAKINVSPQIRAEQARQQAQVRRAYSAAAEDVIAAVRKEANVTQAAAQEDFSSQYLRNQGYLAADTLVDQQQGRILGQVDHFANAVNSAEDQTTGRVKAAIQRNEDANLAAVEMAEDAVDSQLARMAQQSPETAGLVEVDAAINQAASQLEDGLPIDQAERTIGPVSSQEMVEMAKQEMISRRAKLEEAGLRPGTVRFERALAQPFRTSAGAQVRGTGKASIALPAGPIRQTVQGVSATEPLIERAVPNVGPEAVVTKTPTGTAIRGASPSYHEAMPKERTRLLYGTAEPLVPGAPEEMTPDIRGRLRGGIQPQAAPGQLSKQEIVYSAVDRPAPEEIAGGSAGIGVYGLEPGYVPGAMSKATGEYSAAAERIPSQPTFKERKTGFEGLTSQQLISGAEQAKSPALRSAFEQEAARRTTTKASLEASEALRRARIEGRDPQAILRQFGIGR